MKNELIQLNYNIDRAFLGLRVIGSRTVQSPQPKRVSRIFRETQKGVRQVSTLNLKNNYQKLTKKLNKSYQKAVERTYYERRLFNTLRKTRFNIRYSYWIGPCNVDLFLPTIGLAIEVDGEIHNIEPKIKKDQAKAKFLHTLGIAVISVGNLDVGKVGQELFRDLPKNKRLTTRTKTP